MTSGPNPERATRLSMRRQARALLRDPRDVDAHMNRLRAALELPGAEPAQGALADLFVVFGEAHATLKLQALRLARQRLAAHVARWFEAQLARAPLPRITPLATRWSVLARPSADISTRARRCSVDDSRALAEQVIAAYAAGDAAAQQAFLHHCVTCHDNLAFMLARRELLRSGEELPPEWETVSQQLEHMERVA